MPSSSSESSSSSSKGFNGARCFWRLMMISPSFSFERTKARRVLSLSLCFFVFVGKRTTEKKRASLFDLSFFSFWAPFVLLCHFYVERERERDVKKRRGKKATKAPTSSRRQNAKVVRRQKKTKEKNSLGNSLSLSCELSPRDNEKTKTKTKTKTKPVFERRRQKWE